jgi:carbamoyltransferase
MYTLGINAAFQDPAACLVRDGMVLAAVEEERFTRRRQSGRPNQLVADELPFDAIDACLRAAGITLADVHHVAYAYDPTLQSGQHSTTAPRLLERALGAGPDDLVAHQEALFHAAIADAPRRLVNGAAQYSRLRGMGQTTSLRWHFVAHHLAHAASAFLPSPFEHAAVLTLDGRGERATTSYALGEAGWLEPLGEVHMPHSLGALATQVAQHLGFAHADGEQAVMALAQHGRPRYRAAFREIVRVTGRGPLHRRATAPERAFWAGAGARRRP